MLHAVHHTDRVWARATAALGYRGRATAALGYRGRATAALGYRGRATAALGDYRKPPQL